MKGKQPKLRIREIRKRRHLTQRALGALSGMSWAAVSRLESGHVDPRLSTLERVAKALEVPVGKLLA